MCPFQSLNLFLYDQALKIVIRSTTMDKDNNQLKKLKLTGITALKYKRYNIILHRPLHEGRERIKIRISVFLVTHPLVSKISLATRTLLLDKTLFLGRTILKLHLIYQRGGLNKPTTSVIREPNGISFNNKGCNS